MASLRPLEQEHYTLQTAEQRSKKKLDISFPAQQGMTPFDFVRQSDTDGKRYWLLAGEKMSRFIIQAIRSFQDQSQIPSPFFGPTPCFTLDSEEHPFLEVIKNAFDAFALDTEPSPQFILRCVVCIKDHQLIVKIKDNGMGWKKKNGDLYTKSKPFYFNSGCGLQKPLFTTEPTRKVLGGRQQGLLGFQMKVEYYYGTMHIKNRKNRGCAISITWPLKKPD